MTTTEHAVIGRLDRLRDRRNAARRRVDQVDDELAAAIADALEHGHSLTAIATRLQITRQALTRYIDRRSKPHA